MSLTSKLAILRPAFLQHDSRGNICEVHPAGFLPMDVVKGPPSSSWAQPPCLVSAVLRHKWTCSINKKKKKYRAHQKPQENVPPNKKSSMGFLLSQSLGSKPLDRGVGSLSPTLGAEVMQKK